MVGQSEQEIISTLMSISRSYGAWQAVLTQETGVYTTLNRFKYTGGGDAGEYVVAEGWIPSAASAEIRAALDTACRESKVGQLGATMEKSVAPHGAPRARASVARARRLRARVGCARASVGAPRRCLPGSAGRRGARCCTPAAPPAAASTG